MSVGVVDSGVVIGWYQGTHRSYPRLLRLFGSCRNGQTSLLLSVVNFSEVLRITAGLKRETGTDPLVLLRASGVSLHKPDEAVAYRVSKLRSSLADAFAAATALELGARLHTTDGELVRQLKDVRLQVTHY